MIHYDSRSIENCFGLSLFILLVILAEGTLMHDEFFKRYVNDTQNFSVNARELRPPFEFIDYCEVVRHHPARTKARARIIPSIAKNVKLCQAPAWPYEQNIGQLNSNPSPTRSLHPTTFVSASWEFSHLSDNWNDAICTSEHDLCEINPARPLYTTWCNPAHARLVSDGRFASRASTLSAFGWSLKNHVLTVSFSTMHIGSISILAPRTSQLRNNNTGWFALAMAIVRNNSRRQRVSVYKHCKVTHRTAVSSFRFTAPAHFRLLLSRVTSRDSRSWRHARRKDELFF